MMACYLLSLMARRDCLQVMDQTGEMEVINGVPMFQIRTQENDGIHTLKILGIGGITIMEGRIKMAILLVTIKQNIPQIS